MGREWEENLSKTQFAKQASLMFPSSLSKKEFDSTAGNHGADFFLA